MRLTRRDMIKMGALGSAALLLPLERTARSALQLANRLDPSLLPAVGQLPFSVPKVAKPTRTTLTVPGTWINPAHEAGRDPVPVEVDYYEFHMRQPKVPILPGLPETLIWGYRGTTPGPTIHAERGRPVLVRHYNDITRQHPVLRYGAPETSVHLHGNPSLPQHDGYASDTTSAGVYKDYWYPATEDARTLWYHDHGVHHTASNAYMGLAGMYLLHDDEERASGLPLRGSPDDQYGNPYDVPLILRDAMFDTGAQLIFADNDESGAYGDVILVNGVPWPNMKVEPRQYRFRILNAAVSRSFDLALSVTGSTARLPLTVVGTDGGLMEVAQATNVLRMGMAERYEIVIDFSSLAGKTLLLRNLKPENNLEFPTTGSVMQFQVGTTVTFRGKNATAPGKTLRSRPACMALEESASMPARTLDFVRANGHWTINGKTWADVIASGFTDAVAKPKLDDVEVWTLTNLSGGWFHPVHIHLIDFKILSRTGKRVGVQPFERGPKDVVYVGENETVKLIAKFGPQAGRYMLHCHNLVHEDHDMMHQFWVEAPDGAAVVDYDPMGSRAADSPGDGSLDLPVIDGVAPQFPPVVV